ncbi:hypothetical protein [Halohasta salina]|uniref:hypothetical protein n=1 Tax=Halohasta salina TaxID=2961621 RepID=UPI0020A3FC3D|nr:hypothetical protein [Halohasta salina]
MSSRLLHELGSLPSTVVDWWRRTTAATAAEQWLVLGGLPAMLVSLWVVPPVDGPGFSLAVDSLFESPQTLSTAFTTNYMHASGRHLFDNLLNFWITLFGIYPLVAVADWHRQFRLSAGVYLLIGPFVIAWLTLQTLGTITDQPSVGFSGIVAAFLGFLPVVLAAAASEVTDGEVDAEWAAVPFLLSLAVVFAVPSVSYFPVQPMVAFGLVVCGLTIGGVLWQAHPPRRLASYNRRLDPDVRLAFLIGTTVFVFGVAGALLFVRPGTNVWGHLAGYLVGFAVPYFGFVMRPLRISVPE